jgi:uncharacterized protein (TIGR03437 family)
MKRIAMIGLCFSLLAMDAAAQPSISAVLNAASYTATVAPGGWIAIFGTKLAPSTATAQSLPLQNTLGGVTVTVGGAAAPLLFVSATQINALIPADVAIPANTVTPVVVSAAGQSATYNIRLTRDAPAIFTRNGAGTGRALLFDAKFATVDTVRSGDTLILYATGLGPTNAAGQTVDGVEVYIGERKAQVMFAGLAPGFPGIYQLNVVAPVPATDRVVVRAGGWQSNIADIGIAAGANAANVTGSVSALYPTADPFFTLPLCTSDDPDAPPCGPGLGNSVMLHAGSFSVGLDLLPGATPFDIAAVSAAGSSLISIDPAAGTFTATITTITQRAALGDFSSSITPLWDYNSCVAPSAVCLPFPGSLIPPSRLDPWQLQADRQLPVPDTATVTSPNGTLQISGKLSGARFVIDSQTNAALSRFGGFVQAPYGPFDKAVSTFKLYVDGRMVMSRDYPYTVVHR